jgi:hypothetical protein
MFVVVCFVFFVFFVVFKQPFSYQRGGKWILAQAKLPTFYPITTKKVPPKGQNYMTRISSSWFENDIHAIIF